MKTKPIMPDPNVAETSTADFLQYYNLNVPTAFPRASLAALEEFKKTHLALFGKKSTWSIDKHRKRLMDWLFSYRGE
jgi:hypothetical protein